MDHPTSNAGAEPYLDPRFIRRSWYVAAWDHEVTAEGMLARTLLNEPVLLYRDGQGVTKDPKEAMRLFEYTY